MENLEKEVNKVFSVFYRECKGNRLNQFSFGSLAEIVSKMIRDYKVEKKKSK